MLLASAAFVAPSVGPAPGAGPAVVAPGAVMGVMLTPAFVASLPEPVEQLPESAFEQLIHEAAARYGLAPALIRAVIHTESSFNPMAVSSAGAQGLMQLTPALAADLGVTDVFDPRTNIMAGARHLSALIARYHGDVALALATYNAGAGAVLRYQGIPPFKETQHYVKTILDLVARSK